MTLKDVEGAAVLDIQAVVVMPENAIAACVDGVRNAGARAAFTGHTSTNRGLAAKDLGALVTLSTIETIAEGLRTSAIGEHKQEHGAGYR